MSKFEQKYTFKLFFLNKTLKGDKLRNWTKVKYTNLRKQSILYYLTFKLNN